jgi:hypothetical protein
VPTEEPNVLFSHPTMHYLLNLGADPV